MPHPSSLPPGGKVSAKLTDEGSFVPRPAAASRGYIAPRRERFLCLRRPHFFQQRKKWGKERRQKLRFCTSSRAMADSDFPRILAGIAFCRRCRIKGLCLRSPARRLTRPLASATAGVFRSYRCTPISLPLEGSAVLNDTPQSLPPGGKVSAKLTDEGAPVPPAGVLTISPAALAATYPLRCFAPQWARFDNRQPGRSKYPYRGWASGRVSLRAGERRHSPFDRQ